MLSRFLVALGSSATVFLGALFIYRPARVTLQQRSAAINFFRDAKGDFGIVAHRTAPKYAPENTIAGLKVCKELGAFAVEVDIRMTADGELVLLHDRSVDRTTNGTGFVNALTLEQLKSFTASKGHEAKGEFSKERIPTLDEVVEFCQKNSLRLVLDVRSDHRIIPKLVETFQKNPWMYENAIFTSFFPHMIFWMRRRDPAVLTGIISRRNALLMPLLSTTPGRPEIWWRATMASADYILHKSLHTWLYGWLGVVIVSMYKNEVDEEYVKMWRDRGIQVLVWTVNSLADKAKFHKFVPYMTDCPPEDDECPEQTS